ncbi:ribosomal maturation YjgA family protein [Chryseobacterium proteolyticum]|uniref:ribosomal maturation YjgA family protein n=1 Tax=Chryseobacterium proteolyticum TaxID=118127 RepID=UPI003983C62A
MKLQFNIKYLILTILLFLTEVIIATALKNVFFVRAYLGDVIVVILLYTFVKSFITIDNTKLITGIFIFSCIIEFAQYFNVAEKAGFQKGSLMYIVIGNSFSWVDIACYAIGCLFLYLIIKVAENKSFQPEN